MKTERRTGETRVKIDVPFSRTEAAEFQRYLWETGRSRGAWVRRLVLDAMKTDRQEPVNAREPNYE